MRRGPCGPPPSMSCVSMSLESTDARDAVIAEAAHWQGRGKASGMSIDVRQLDIFEFRGGQIVRSDSRPQVQEALEAAGLSE